MGLALQPDLARSRRAPSSRGLAPVQAQRVAWPSHPYRGSCLALVPYLRRLAGKVDGHALSTIGGLSTDARWCPAGPQHDRCAICLCDVTPSVEHLLWHCPFFTDLRCQLPPRSPLARRLGWYFPAVESHVDRVRMMGNIRCAVVKHRRHRSTWNVRGAEAAAWAAEEAG